MQIIDRRNIKEINKKNNNTILLRGRNEKVFLTVTFPMLNTSDFFHVQDICAVREKQKEKKPPIFYVTKI